MAQFDVHRNLAPSKTRVPFLLDVQADLLKVLATRVVIPLVKPVEVGNLAVRHLHFEVNRVVLSASHVPGKAERGPERSGPRAVSTGPQRQRSMALGSRSRRLCLEVEGERFINRTEIVRALDVIIGGV